MSELKHQLMLNKDMSWVPCYIKSEADKAIADLEESHKKEVSQLLMEIAELKEEIAESNRMHRLRNASEELPEDAIYSQELYDRLDFELREAKNDAWAANLVLADTRNDLRKQLIKRCRQNQEYCFLRFINEGKTRTLFWLKWQDRWIELEKFYKESETEDR